MKSEKTMVSEKSQTSVENMNKQNSNYNTELTERHDIDETPFTAIRIEDKWFLTMGKYRLSEELTSLEECKEDAARADWNRIMSIMGIMIEEYNTKK